MNGDEINIGGKNLGTAGESHMHPLVLPSAPDSQPGPVKAWDESVAMMTYLPAHPDVNPMFLTKRVYQGSSGDVYPLPFIDRIEPGRPTASGRPFISRIVTYG